MYSVAGHIEVRCSGTVYILGRKASPDCWDLLRSWGYSGCVLLHLQLFCQSCWESQTMVLWRKREWPRVDERKWRRMLNRQKIRVGLGASVHQWGWVFTVQHFCKWSGEEDCKVTNVAAGSERTEVVGMSADCGVSCRNALLCKKQWSSKTAGEVQCAIKQHVQLNAVQTLLVWQWSLTCLVLHRHQILRL